MTNLRMIVGGTMILAIGLVALAFGERIPAIIVAVVGAIGIVGGLEPSIKKKAVK